MTMSTTARIAPGKLGQLGLINWAFCRLASRVIGAPDAHIFSTLGRARGLFRGWLHYSAMMMPFGRISRYETELAIIRIAYLRRCQYELDHHRRLGARAGITPETLARVFEGPDAGGLSVRERALLRLVDEIVTTRHASDDSWANAADHYSERQLIELVMLIGQYDSLATTLGVLRVERDFDDRS